MENVSDTSAEYVSRNAQTEEQEGASQESLDASGSIQEEAGATNGPSDVVSADEQDKSTGEQAKVARAQNYPKTVVCIGDSIASGHVFGYDEQDPWPVFLQQQLMQQDASWELTNLGVSGTMLLSNALNPYRDTGNLELAKELHPGYVLVMLGTNDSYDQNWDENAYRSELLALVEELYAATPQSLVVLLSPPHVFCDPDPYGSGVYHMNDDIIGNQIRPIMQEVAAQTDSLFVDVYQLTEGRSDWFPDTVHPNGDGNRAIADYVYKSVFEQGEALG